MPNSIRQLAVLTAALFTLNVHASDDWYRVELIVFTQGNNAGIEDERWPPNVDLSYPLDALHLLPADAITEQLAGESLRPTQIEEDTFVAANSIGSDDGYLAGIEPPLAEPQTRLITSPSVTTWVNDLTKLWRQHNAPINDSMANDLGSVNDSSNAQWQAELAKLTQVVYELAEYVPLNEEVFEFSERQLTRNRYRVLHHSAWHQYIPSASNGEPVIVLGGREFGQHFELEGTIQLDRPQRWVHADVNLWLSTFELQLDDSNNTERLPPIPPRSVELNPAHSELGNTNSDDFTGLNLTSNLSTVLGANPVMPQGQSEGEQWVSTGQFALRSSQRMRSGLQYYVDHPAFGLVIKLTRYENREERQKALLPRINSESSEAAQR